MARDLVIVALARIAASLVALAAGFRAVSDDDFARVVLAQAWAHAPRLDPTGTSWLPAPFWLTGAVLRLLGPGLGVARGVAFALGLASALLVYVAARWITEDPLRPNAAASRPALAGALVAVAFPWSACLGVATVPELPTAALTLLAIASLCTPSPRRRLCGAAALTVATLCRYEPWPVAAAFAAFSLLSALRLGQSRAAQAQLALAALLALAGPAAWLAWNHAAHGDALFFLARVAAYRQAVGAGGGGSALRLFAYPAAMFREEPELVVSPLVLALAARLTRRTAVGRAAVPAGLLARAALPYALPAALAAFQIAALSAALVRDGAPTHHPERATLVALLVLALAVGDLGTRFVAAAPPASRRALAAAAAALVVLGLIVRPHLRREHFRARADEVAIGRAAAALTPPDAPLLIEVADYGYLAILAALARPGGRVVPDRSVDPRDPPAASSFDDPAALRRRVAETGARHVVARVAPPVALLAGSPRASHGVWALWDAPAATPPPEIPHGNAKNPTEAHP